MIDSFLIYFFISFILLYLSGIISYKLKLLDIPNDRKIHSKATVYTGGITICFILLLSITLFNVSNPTLNIIISIAFLIALVGLIDDIYSLSVGSKLALQIIPIFYLIISENLFLTNVGDYNYFKLELGALAIPFSLLSILYLMNAFNYFDGTDGTLSCISISILIILFFLTQNNDLHIIFITILIPIIIFLFFNFSVLNLPKIFLGDSGSLPFGFIISFILIYMANENHAHHILLAWSVAILAFEFLSINIIRFIRKKNLFKAGKDHLHHLIYKKTNSVFLVNLFIVTLNYILFIIGYLSFYFISPLTSFVLFIVFFLFFLFFRNYHS